MNFLWLCISIVLSLVHIDASTLETARQATTQCPGFNLCDYVHCVNGQCIDDKNATDCFRCQCPPEFQGRLCDLPVSLPNTCALPCQNNGQCQLLSNNTYACVCPEYYIGAQCETSVLATHPCVTMAATVCKNGATCTINNSSYLCNCASGWTGPNCDIPDILTTCNPNPCDAHGICVEAILPNGDRLAVCRCNAQWTGVRCDVEIPSGTTPTINITITTTTATMTMTTATGTYTTTSSSSTSTLGRCTSTSCVNGGTCYNTGNDYICVCPPQYAGPSCSQPATITTTSSTTALTNDACLVNPCNNGGSCYKYNGGFICVCTSGYTGAICDTVKTTAAPTTPSSSITCTNQPCQNGATCYNAGNSYFCYCGTGSRFTGKNCETPITVADPTSSTCSLNCSPGGYCVRANNKPDGYACMCGDTLRPKTCLE